MLLTKHCTMKTYGCSGGIVPHILNLGIRWRWVVSLTPRQLYSRGRSSPYPFHRKVVRFRSRSGGYGKEEDSLPLPGIELRSPSLLLKIIIILYRHNYR